MAQGGFGLFALKKSVRKGFLKPHLKGTTSQRLNNKTAPGLEVLTPLDSYPTPRGGALVHLTLAGGVPKIDQTQPVGLARPATLQAPFAGPDGNNS